MQSQRKMDVSISGLPSNHVNDNFRHKQTTNDQLARIMMKRETKECYSKNQIRLSSRSLNRMDTFHGGRMGIRYGLKDALSKFSDSLIWMVDNADVDNLEQSGALLSSLGKILQKNDIAVMVYLCCNEMLKKKGLALPAKDVIVKMKLQKCMPKNVKWTVVEGNAPPSYGYTYDRKTKKNIKSPEPTMNDFKMAQKIWQWALNAKFGSKEFPLPEDVKFLPLAVDTINAVHFELKETDMSTVQKASVLDKKRTSTTKSSSVGTKKANLIQRAFRNLISVF